MGWMDEYADMIKEVANRRKKAEAEVNDAFAAKLEGCVQIEFKFYIEDRTVVVYKTDTEYRLAVFLLLEKYHDIIIGRIKKE